MFYDVLFCDGVEMVVLRNVQVEGEIEFQLRTRCQRDRPGTSRKRREETLLFYLNY